MGSLNLEQVQPYLMTVIGVILIIASLLKKPKSESLKIKGVRCEGIIFKLDYSPGSSLDRPTVKDKITVRFVTNKQEWITEDLGADYMIAYTGQYKEGDKVVVIYNPDKPSDFMLETKQSQTIGRLIFFCVGLIFTGAGIYELLRPS
ncbi:MAG: DUF3592 domain-containing protein [Bacteroidota bacterium]|nr:DUF3592 domain-containing protein [Bacteroidota bacterium]MDP4258626.1 DUF3592 domain-containing protein [Bacteroidota bacterium]